MHGMNMKIIGASSLFLGPLNDDQPTDCANIMINAKD